MAYVRQSPYPTLVVALAVFAPTFWEFVLVPEMRLVFDVLVSTLTVLQASSSKLPALTSQENQVRATTVKLSQYLINSCLFRFNDISHTSLHTCNFSF